MSDRGGRDREVIIVPPGCFLPPAAGPCSGPTRSCRTHSHSHLLLISYGTIVSGVSNRNGMKKNATIRRRRKE